MIHDEMISAADQYRSDGYEVIERPTRDDLPDFLAGLGPDLIARKGDENVVIQVVEKDRLNREKHFLAYWLGKVNARPGWRFDLVITNTSPWPDQVDRDAHDLGIEEVRARLQEASQTFDQGFLEPAFLFASAMLEAALRIVARSLDISPTDNTPSHVMKQIYVLGAISGTELESLRELIAVRNSVAHGLSTAKLDGDAFHEVMALTGRLLEVAEESHPRLSKI